MADDPDLTGLNNAANANPTDEHVAVQKIKSDNEVVGGVDIGALDNVALTAENRVSEISAAVERALKFRPVRMKSQAVLTAAAQLRHDFQSATSYVNARSTVTKQIDRLISRPGHHESVSDKQNRIDAIIMERIIGLRLQEANKTSQQQLIAAKNLLKFQTTTATTFMRQSLALQYNQIYTLKDLVTVTKAFADMAETKLEAIKINTRLPDIKKKTLADRIKDMAFEKGLKYAGRGVVTLLAHESFEDVKNSIQSARDKISGKIQSIRNFSLASAAPKTKSAEPSVPLMQRLRESARPENLWMNTKAPREFLAELIKKTAIGEEKHTPDILLSKILEEITRQNSTVRTGPMMPSSIGTSGLVSKQLNTINMAIMNFKSSYEKNSNKLHELMTNINKTLSEMSVMAFGNGDGRGEYSSGSNIRSRDPRIGTGVHKARNFLSKFRPPFFRAKHFVFTDVYLKDSVDPGNPLVTKEQFDSGSVTRVDGKPVKSLKDLNVPILDIATGLVLISAKDIKTGLVDINNLPFKGSASMFGGGLGGFVMGTIKTPFAVATAYGKFLAGGINASGRFLFRKRDRTPYVDVYLKGKIIPGRPLVTGEKFREGLIFADGSRVLDVSRIDKPVLDPKTGQTLITEEDIAIGLVDVFGESIGNRKSRFSVLGGLFDISKLGIKTAGGLAVPILNMYSEMFKMMPKAILGVGGFISKSIIGILSGKAPGALAKGLVGITGNITKMYASVFGMGLKGIGAVGKSLFGRLFGGRKSSMGDVSKKDIYDLISVRLDHIYSLLDMRLANDNVRPGSYQDHENRLKRDREKLRHEREEEPEVSGSGNVSVMERLARLLGLGGGADDDGTDKSDKNDSGGGVVKDAETAAEAGAGGYFAKKLGRFFPKFKGLRKAGAGIVNAAKSVLKVGSKTGVKEAAEVAGKKIPGLGLVIGAGLGIDDAVHGDYVGAAGNVTSGLVSMVPFVGTAASFSIDGWLLYRDANKIGAEKGINPLLKQRLKVYGVDSSSKDNIETIEARTLQFVVSGGSQPITMAEARGFSKLFGFDPNNDPQFQYFCSWLDNRFRNGYLSYLAVIKKHGYNVTVGDDIREKDIPKIVSEYNSMCSSFVAKYSNLIPNVASFKASNSNSQKSTVTTPPFQSNTPAVTQPSPPAANNNLPITNASYVVPPSGGGSNTQQPQSFNIPANNNNGVQTQELTYTPGGGIGSGGGFKSFNGAPLPGGGIMPSMAVQMAAARANYANTVNSAPAQPITNAETQKRAIQAVNYFVSQGWTKEQASGIVGSLIRESKLNTTAVGDEGAALGIAQWHSDRYGPMMQALYPGKSVGDLTFEQQLAGIQWELNGPERRAAQMLKSAKDPGTAGAYASKYYERPADTTGEMNIRAGLAETVYNTYTGNPNSSTQKTQVASAAPANVNNASYKPGAQPTGAGPSSNVIAPIQKAVAVAQNTQQATTAITQTRSSAPQPPMIVQASFHPDMINAIRAQSQLAAQSLETLGGIHKAVSNVYGHLQDVHGPDGVFNTIAENTANNGSNGSTVFAPTINTPQPNNNNCDDNVGFSVKKKREQRYAM